MRRSCRDNLPTRTALSVWLAVCALAPAHFACSDPNSDPATPATTAPAAGPWNLPGKPPHLVAHYLPWFSGAAPAESGRPPWGHWKWDGGGPSRDPERRRDDGSRDIAAVRYPLIGPYDSASPAVVRYHLRTAAAAGVQAFLVLWYGPGSDTDHRISLLLEEAQRAGIKVALCYEEKTNFPPYRRPACRDELIDTVAADLSYVLTHYGSHPAYLKRNGKPFVCQFNGSGAFRIGPKYLTSLEWQQVLSRLGGGIVYGRQGLEGAYHPPVAAAYDWWSNQSGASERFARGAAELRDAGRLDFFVTMLCPGFDDTGVWGWGAGPRKQERDGLRTLRHTFDRAFDGGPELVQVVTWNDFNEGTQVEPTREDGFWYLDAVETWWGERTGRPVDLADNREPFLDYARQCSPTERRELPPEPWGEYLKHRPLVAESFPGPASVPSLVPHRE